MIEDIFDYEELVDADPDCLSFSSCTFKKDFGVWKKGQKADCISVETSVPFRMVEWSYEGVEVRAAGLKLEAT